MDVDLRGVSGDYLDDDGLVKPDRIAPFWVLPERLQSAIRLVRNELHAATTRTVALVRWRIADDGPHQPLVSLREQWSLDGHDWHPLPFPLSAVGSSRALPRFSEIHDDVQKLLDQGVEEPLAHALWREAWELRTANPRSSLLVGMAALEVGVKHYLSAAAPETKWLLEEMPAPPIRRLLGEYIPSLPTPSGVNPAHLEKAVAGVIRESQGLRNKVAHAGRETIPADKLVRTLETVRGVLLNLDRYRGYDWPRDVWS